MGQLTFPHVDLLRVDLTSERKYMNMLRLLELEPAHGDYKFGVPWTADVNIHGLLPGVRYNDYHAYMSSPEFPCQRAVHVSSPWSPVTAWYANPNYTEVGDAVRAFSDGSFRPHPMLEHVHPENKHYATMGSCLVVSLADILMTVRRLGVKRTLVGSQIPLEVVVPAWQVPQVFRFLTDLGMRAGVQFVAASRQSSIKPLDLPPLDVCETSLMDARRSLAPMPGGPPVIWVDSRLGSALARLAGDDDTWDQYVISIIYPLFLLLEAEGERNPGIISVKTLSDMS
jgi:hypothetical protein